jgi:lipopolysaccharide/colanic/teichoic acid biosynthesis glycosyltransferase
VNQRHSGQGFTLSPITVERVPAEERDILGEDSFQKMISLERKRTERSGKPFLLMLLDMGDHPHSERTSLTLGQILAALALTTRETDVTGWYKNKSVVGVMFTDIGSDNRTGVIGTVITRVSETLRGKLTPEQLNMVSISFHPYPEEWDHNKPQRPSNSTLYPDLSKRDEGRKAYRATKRVMDIIGSVAALIAFSPLFLVITAAIKLTSKGPVFFRQPRVGQHGISFTFLKFRSMYVNNDASAHKEFVKKLIAGKAEQHSSNGNGGVVYKMTRDSRITPIGAFLRKTSLDELPQFLNVLKGEMSLVGPRPAIAYEVEAYDTWHRRRVLEAKPGITGLWQVCGRSRVKFDEMVRLDLRYAQSWTPWLDIKILMRTPAVVILGDGAH